MKKIYTYIIFAFALMQMQSIQLFAQQQSVCNSVEIRKKARLLFKPDFHYDASKTTFVTFMNKKQFKELEVPLYIGERYKVIFSTESLPQDVDIEVFDKKYSSKSRTKIFSSKDVEKSEDGTYIFEPKKPLRRMYIDYSIPPTQGEIEKGCIIVTLGYKI